MHMHRVSWSHITLRTCWTLNHFAFFAVNNEFALMEGKRPLITPKARVKICNALDKSSAFL